MHIEDWIAKRVKIIVNTIVSKVCDHWLLIYLLIHSLYFHTKGVFPLPSKTLCFVCIVLTDSLTFLAAWEIFPLWTIIFSPGLSLCSLKVTPNPSSPWNSVEYREGSIRGNPLGLNAGSATSNRVSLTHYFTYVSLSALIWKRDKAVFISENFIPFLPSFLPDLINTFHECAWKNAWHIIIVNVVIYCSCCYLDIIPATFANVDPWCSRFRATCLPWSNESTSCVLMGLPCRTSNASAKTLPILT